MKKYIEALYQKNVVARIDVTHLNELGILHFLETTRVEPERYGQQLQLVESDKELPTFQEPL